VKVVPLEVVVAALAAARRRVEDEALRVNASALKISPEEYEEEEYEDLSFEDALRILEGGAGDAKEEEALRLLKRAIKGGPLWEELSGEVLKATGIQKSLL